MAGKDNKAHLSKLSFVLVTNNFVYLSVVSGPVWDHRTMPVVQEGQGPKDGIYVSGSVAEGHKNNAPNARATCGSSKGVHKELISNEGGNRKIGMLKEPQTQTVNAEADKPVLAHQNVNSGMQDPDEYYVHQDCISLIDIESAMSEITDRLQLYGTLFTSKRGKWPVHKLSQFPTYVQSLRAEFHLGERVQAAVDAASDFELPHELLTRDSDELKNQHNGDSASLVRARRGERGDNRFNAKRCMAAFWDDSEYVRLTNIATNGATVNVPDGFVKQCVPEKPRRK